MTENNWGVGGKYLDLFRAELVSGVWVPKKPDGSANATAATDRITRLQLVVTAEWQPQDDATFTLKLDQDHDDNTIIDDVLYEYAWTPYNAASSSTVSERKYRNGSKKGGASAASSTVALVAVDYSSVSEDEVDIKLAAALCSLKRTSGGFKSQMDNPSSPQFELVSILPEADTDFFALIDGATGLVKKGSGGISSFVQAQKVGLKVKWVVRAT